MTPSQLQGYIDMQKEVDQIASRIITERAVPEPKNSVQAVWRFTPRVYLEEVWFSGNGGPVFIQYCEDWGQGGNEYGMLKVSAEEFCDPKYLLDIIE